MTNIKTGLIALATATSMFALGACGEANDADVAAVDVDNDGVDEMVVTDAANMDDADMMVDTDETAMMGAADSYDVDGEAFETPRVRQGPTMIAARTAPLTADQDAYVKKIDVKTVEMETKAEVKKMVAAKERLTDPADDGDASFGQLDRNNDGKLSAAEFAIYDLAGVNPTVKGDKIDQTMPYVSTDAINMVAQDFARIDTSGDFFLDRSEFNAVTM